MSVNAGKRVIIETALFAGPAGMVEKEDGTVQLSFALDGRRQMPSPGRKLIVDGKCYEVLTSGRSTFAQSMTFITAAPASETSAIE